MLGATATVAFSGLHSQLVRVARAHPGPYTVVGRSKGEIGTWEKDGMQLHTEGKSFRRLLVELHPIIGAFTTRTPCSSKKAVASSPGTINFCYAHIAEAWKLRISRPLLHSSSR